MASSLLCCKHGELTVVHCFVATGAAAGVDLLDPTAEVSKVLVNGRKDPRCSGIFVTMSNWLEHLHAKGASAVEKRKGRYTVVLGGNGAGSQLGSDLHSADSEHLRRRMRRWWHPRAMRMVPASSDGSASTTASSTTAPPSSLAAPSPSSPVF